MKVTGDLERPKRKRPGTKGGNLMMNNEADDERVDSRTEEY